MITKEIEQILLTLEKKGFQKNNEVNHLLRSILFRKECVMHNLDLLKNINFAQIKYFDQMNESKNNCKVYNINSSNCSISCFSAQEVNFQTKRIVCEIFVTLDNCIDILWQCAELIYDWIPPFKEDIGKNSKIESISKSSSSLHFKQFTQTRLADFKDLRDALNYLRNKFTHGDYSVYNDVQANSSEDGHGNIICKGYAVFTFDNHKKYIEKLSYTDREYIKFSQQCFEFVFQTYEELLETFKNDLSISNEIPIKYNITYQGRNVEDFRQLHN